MSPASLTAGDTLDKQSREIHSMKPTVHVGKRGVTDSLVNEIEIQLKKNGMVKVKFNITMALEELLEKIPDAAVVAKVGRTLVLRRRVLD